MLYENLLQKSRVKSPKRAFSHETLPPKVKREAPSEHTRQAACQAVSRFQPLQTTPTFTSTTTRNLTIPSACHEHLHVHTSNTHKVLRLKRNDLGHLRWLREPRTTQGVGRSGTFRSAPTTRIKVPTRFEMVGEAFGRSWSCFVH